MTDEEFIESWKLSDARWLRGEYDRLREENKRMASQLEKTAKRFDAMKFADFAAECRAAINEWEKPAKKKVRQLSEVPHSELDETINRAMTAYNAKKKVRR